jgi:hypothetical protein
MHFGGNCSSSSGSASDADRLPNCPRSSSSFLSLSSLSNTASVRFIKSFLEICPFLSVSIRSNPSITFGRARATTSCFIGTFAFCANDGGTACGCNNHCKRSNGSLPSSWCHRKFSLSEVKTQGQLPGAITRIFCSLLGLEDSKRARAAHVRCWRRVICVVEHIGERCFKSQMHALADCH